MAIKRFVSAKITDGPHETPELTDDGVQFISAEAVKNGRIDFNLRRGFISHEDHRIYSRKCLPPEFDTKRRKLLICLKRLPEFATTAM